MEGFLAAANNANAGYTRRQQDIENINEVGRENYNAQRASAKATFAAKSGQVAQANEAVQSQDTMEQVGAGIAYEPLIKSTANYGAKSLYAAGKQAKASRLGARAEALEGGDTEAASALESRGGTEIAADAMDSEIAQNIGAVLKAPGQIVSKGTQLVGDATKSIGKAVYRGGQRAVQAIRGKVQGQIDQATGQESSVSQPVESSAGEGDEGVEFASATGDDFDIAPSGLGDASQITNVRSVFSTQGGKFTPSGSTSADQQLSGSSSEQQGNLDLNRANDAGTKLPQGQEGITEGSELDQLAPMREAANLNKGQAGEQASLKSAGDSAEAQSDTLINSAGDEVSSSAAGAGTGAGEAGAAGAASGAAEAGAAGAAGAEAGAGAIAADAAEAGLAAAAEASLSVPGVGEIAAGILGIGAAIAGAFGAKAHHQSKPKPLPTPPPPKQLSTAVSESAPVMDSSIYRATGYNQMA